MGDSALNFAWEGTYGDSDHHDHSKKSSVSDEGDVAEEDGSSEFRIGSDRAI